MTEFKPTTKIIEVRMAEIASFVPEGAELPTQVHLIFEMMDTIAPPFVMRIKSARALDSLIAALIDHRKDVFGSHETD